MDDIRKKSKNKNQIDLSATRKTVMAPPPEPPPEEEQTVDSSFMEKFGKRENGEIILTEESEEKSFPELENEMTAKPNRRGWVFLASAILILLAVGLVSTVFARLTVTVKLKQEAVNLQEVITAFDASVSRPLLPQRVIPAEKLELNDQLAEEFPATGRKYIEEQARGKVKIYNAFSSSPQVLVANTRFLTDSGILFRLPQAITVPSAKIEEGKIVPSFIEAELVADEPGEGGNIRDGLTLKIPGFKGSPKYDGFYAASAAQFANGFKGEATVVTAEDLKAAQERVTQKIYDALQRELFSKIPPDFKLLDQFREVQITGVAAPKAESRLDSFRVEARAVARALVFRETDVQELVRNLIIKAEEKKELVINPFGVQYRVRSIDFQKGKAEVALTGEVKTKPVISLEEFAGLLSGKKEGSIITALQNRAELAAFHLSFFPPWLFSAPGDPAKIKLTIEE